MEDRLSALIKNASAGDHTAFRELITIYEPLIAGIVNKYEIYACDCDADDLRQEAAIALFGAVRSYDSNNGVTFGLYAKICIKNRIISKVRKCHGITVPMTEKDTDDIFDPDFTVADHDPENEVIGKESYHLLINLIDENLTVQEKSVFKLYIRNKSYNEIAAVLGIQQKSVDNAIYRIKKKIKKLI